MKNSVMIESPRKITAEFKALRVTSGDAGSYNGDYEVIPKAFEKTVLPTRNTVLTKDITVLEVPYFEVSNEFGNTVFIASK